MPNTVKPRFRDYKVGSSCLTATGFLGVVVKDRHLSSTGRDAVGVVLPHPSQLGLTEYHSLVADSVFVFDDECTPGGVWIDEDGEANVFLDFKIEIDVSHSHELYGTKWHLHALVFNYKRNKLWEYTWHEDFQDWAIGLPKHFAAIPGRSYKERLNALSKS